MQTGTDTQTNGGQEGARETPQEYQEPGAFGTGGLFGHAGDT